MSLFTRRPRRPSGTIDRGAPSRGDNAQDRPQDFHPTHHNSPAPPLDFDSMVEAVRGKIARLAGSGALDAGTPDVIDRSLEYRRRAWEMPIAHHTARRRQAAQSLHEAATHNLTRTLVQLSEARRVYREADASRAYWRDVLLGTTTNPAPASLSASNPAVTEPRALAEPSSTPEPDLTGLEYRNHRV